GLAGVLPVGEARQGRAQALLRPQGQPAHQPGQGIQEAGGDIGGGHGPSLRDGVQAPLTTVAAAGEDAGMIALIQRVTEASVRVDDEVVGAIGPGLLALVAVQPQDDEASIERMAEPLLAYRVVSDAEGRMHLCLAQAGGGRRLVRRGTLAAGAGKALRPGVTPAAPPEAARAGFERLLERCRALHPVVETGRDGGDMGVSLVDDGLLTFWLQTWTA